MTNKEFDFFDYVPPNVVDSQTEFLKIINENSNIEEYLYKPDEWTGISFGTRRVSNRSFYRCSFSKTLITEIDFRSCKFHECLFVGTILEACEFHDCIFEACNTHKIRFKNTYIDPISFKECLDKRKYANLGVHLYQNLLQDTRGTEQIEFERDAQYLFLKWKRYQDSFESKQSWQKGTRWKSVLLYKKIIGRFIYEFFLGSGVRISHLIFTSIVVVSIFVATNWFCSDVFGLTQEGKPVDSILDILYYTVISLTTVGYGDVTPVTTIGRIVAVCQSIIGYVLFGILVATLFRRIAR